MNIEAFNRRAIRLSFCAALLLSGLSLHAQLSDGDRAYARRAEGALGARARSGPIDEAIRAYTAALQKDASNLEAHWKLLRAYRYKGAYVASSADEKKAIYGTAKTAGERAIAATAAALAGRGVNAARASEREIAAAARAIPGAAEVYLWDAINWGEWAVAYGKLAAARQGAADRIRRQATIALLADPALEGGTPARVLGRLHDQTPRVPLITGWASSREAVRFLRESLKIDPTNKLTILFLAEAMVGEDARTRGEAAGMLRKMVAAPLDPEYPVEDAAAIEEARRLLAKW